MKKIIFLYWVLLGILAPLHPISAGSLSSPLSSEDQQLKTEMNQSWNNVAVALQKKDYSTFIKLVDSRNSSEKISEKDFPGYATMIGRIITVDRLNDPKLTTVAIRHNAEWAAIYSSYVDTESPGESKINLDMAVFHKVGGVWKFSPPNYGNTFTKKATAEENQKEALKLIETDVQFKLPSEK